MTALSIFLAATGRLPIRRLFFSRHRVAIHCDPATYLTATAAIARSWPDLADQRRV